MNYRRETSVGFLINQAARLTQRSFRAQIGKSGLAPAYIPVMLYLLEHRELTQAELGRLSGVEQGSMAELLKRMTREGLITRRRDPSDGRKQVLSLTPAALEQSAHLPEWLRESNEMIRAGISDENYRIFQQTLVQMIDNMKSYVESSEGSETS